MTVDNHKLYFLYHNCKLEPGWNLPLQYCNVLIPREGRGGGGEGVEGYSHIRAIFLVCMLRRKILKSKFTRRANFLCHSIVSSAFKTEHFEYLSSPSYTTSS